MFKLCKEMGIIWFFKMFFAYFASYKKMFLNTTPKPGIYEYIHDWVCSRKWHI